MITTPYKHLEKLSSFPSPSSFMKRLDSTTPVVEYIAKTLVSYDIALFQKICFESRGHQRSNIVCRFRGQADGMHLAFSAHHDIVNPKSHNVHDNLGSVAILMSLAEALAHDDSELINTVDIIFTDGEEVGATGATHMANSWYKRSQPDYLFNLELTASGNAWWVENTHQDSQAIAELLADITENITATTSTPPQDAMAYRWAGVQNAICIGTLPTPELIAWVEQDKYPDTWKLCHSIEDHIDLADPADMWNSVKILTTLAEELTPQMIMAYK